MFVHKKSARCRFLGYLDRLYAYALSLTRQRERACDLVQSCVLRALSAKRVPEDEPAYRSWLFRILHNLHQDEVRREQHSFISLDEPTSGARKDSAGPAALASLSVDYREQWLDELSIEDALENLSREHCEIIILVDILGYSYREAAGMLGIPEGTVMSRISRARARMLERLVEDEADSCS